MLVPVVDAHVGCVYGSQRCVYMACRPLLIYMHYFILHLVFVCIVHVSLQSPPLYTHTHPIGIFAVAPYLLESRSQRSGDLRSVNVAARDVMGGSLHTSAELRDECPRPDPLRPRCPSPRPSRPRQIPAQPRRFVHMQAGRTAEHVSTARMKRQLVWLCSVHYRWRFITSPDWSVEIVRLASILSV